MILVIIMIMMVFFYRIISQKTMKYFRENHRKLKDHHSSYGSECEQSLASDYKTLFNLARHELIDSARVR